MSRTTHWQVSFLDEGEVEFASGVVRVRHGKNPEKHETEAEATARRDWPEEAERASEIRAYPLAEVDEDGLHADDGQRLLSAEELRGARAAEEAEVSACDEAYRREATEDAEALTLARRGALSRVTED